MRLLMLNGSPRRRGSNTLLLLKQFAEGFCSVSGNTSEEIILYELKDFKPVIESLTGYDTMMIAFPLYTDGMPCGVKELIEALDAYRGKLGNLKVVYLIQSGFPEAVHSMTVAKYFDKFDTRMGWKRGGTIIKGGIEGIQMMPEKMLKNLYGMFKGLGQGYATTGELDTKMLNKLRQPVTMGWLMKVMMSLMKLFGMMDFMWNKLLKDNKAFEKRFDKPYAK